MLSSYGYIVISIDAERNEPTRFGRRFHRITTDAGFSGAMIQTNRKSVTITNYIIDGMGTARGPIRPRALRPLQVIAGTIESTLINELRLARKCDAL